MLTWLLVGLAVAVIALIIVRNVPALQAWLGRVKPARETEATPVLDYAVARSLLAEADRMAAEGRYADAAHLLLQRSLEDIGARMPGFIKPDLTSRRIAAHTALPDPLRSAFASIARIVEISLFGGRAVTAGQWTDIRATYVAATRAPMGAAV